ncbi:MAG TPA: HAD family hydrolase [Longimicrobiaceae bacterium]
MERLILFDIDGTLLSAAGAAGGPFRSALERVFGTSGPRRGYSFAGRTDPQIARDLLALGGVPREVADEKLELVWEIYLAGLRETLREREVTVLPGVRELLDELEAEPTVILGLLTGNLREGARLKLEAAGLGFERFEVGAFGSDHADRPELPAVAIRRAEERFGHRFSGKSVVIIGDTPLDIACGEHLGVRTIAVATGNYRPEELAACGPDHVFESLEDLEAVRRAILGD